jgi:hypothetical protein
VKVHEKLKMELRGLFENSESAQLLDFLNMAGGFSLGGQFALVEMLDLMQERGVAVKEILRGLALEWRDNWRFQDFAVRGSPGKNGRVGIENAISLENFYRNFNVHSPLIATWLAIPIEAFWVQTRRSLYRLGDANLKGEREIDRKPKPLGFDRCKIHRLAIGKPMLVERLDNPSSPVWWTTPVNGVQGDRSQ